MLIMPLPESDGVFVFYKIVLNVYSSMVIALDS